jgi:hypothetical protein
VESLRESRQVVGEEEGDDSNELKKALPLLVGSGRRSRSTHALADSGSPSRLSPIS